MINKQPVVIGNRSHDSNIAHHLSSRLSTTHQIQRSLLEIFLMFFCSFLKRFSDFKHLFDEVFLRGDQRLCCNLLNSTYGFQVTSLPTFSDNFRRLGISDQSTQTVWILHLTTTEKSCTSKKKGKVILFGGVASFCPKQPHPHRQIESTPTYWKP